MDFDYTTETITPDSTDILTIGGTGALELSSGFTVDRPGSADAGAIRWNKTETWLEYFNGSIWQTFSSTVLSLTGTSNQVSISGIGGPVYTGAVTLSTPMDFIAPGSLRYTTQLGYSTENITAAGTNQATAAAITKTYTAIDAGGATTGVILPVATFAGELYFIKNDTASIKYIWPPVGVSINSSPINTSTYVESGCTIGFIWDGADWHPYAEAISSGNSGVTVTHVTGNATISNTGVLSFSGSTTGLTPNTPTSGNIVLGGVLNISNGGTGAATTTIAFNNLSPLTTVGDTLYFDGTNNVRLPIGSTNQALTVIAGSPAWANVVNSFSAGSTGLTPNSASTGAITLAGVLALANGGTNANLTAVAGGIVWSNSTQLQIASAGTTGQALISGGSTTPTWQTVASTLTTNQILKGDGSGAFTANGGTYVGSGSYSGVTLQGTVTNATDATTKAYVDAVSVGQSVQPEVKVAQIVDLTTIGNGSSGPIATVGSFVPGIGYTNGTYTNVPVLSNNIGAGADATVVVAGGVVTSFTITASGNRYTVGDELYIGNVAGLGIGFVSTVSTVSASWGNVTYTAGSADQNGGTGIGATLAPASNGLFVLDGFRFSVNDRVLIRVQSNQIQNGIYVVTTLGGPSGTWLLTRATNYDDSVINQVVPGNYVFAIDGKLNKNTSWVETNIGTSTGVGVKTGAIKIGTDNIVYSQYSANTVYSAGTGLELINTEFTNTGVLSITTNTGLSTNVDAIGDVTITNTGVTSATAGAGISISGTGGPAYTGGITISSSALAPSTVQVSSTYTVLAADYTVFADATSAGFTVSLPPSPSPGEIHNIKKIDQTRHAVVISGNGNNVDKYSTASVNVPFLSLAVQWNSTANVWQII